MLSERMYEVHVLQDGYSVLRADGVMTANGTSTLVIGDTHKVIQPVLQTCAFFTGSNYFKKAGLLNKNVNKTQGQK